MCFCCPAAQDPACVKLPFCTFPWPCYLDEPLFCLPSTSLDCIFLGAFSVVYRGVPSVLVEF